MKTPHSSVFVEKKQTGISHNFIVKDFNIYSFWKLSDVKSILVKH